MLDRSRLRASTLRWWARAEAAVSTLPPELPPEMPAASALADAGADGQATQAVAAVDEAVAALRASRETPPARGTPVLRIVTAKVPADQAVRAPAPPGATADPGSAAAPAASTTRPPATPGRRSRTTASGSSATRPRPPMDLRKPLWTGVLTVTLGGAGFLAWAASAPLSEGAPAEGYVKVESSRKPVQHLRGGIVEAVLVQDGQSVQAGQPLLRLNDTEARARMAMVRSRLDAALALQARLLAERGGAAQIDFPPALLDRQDDPAVAEALRTQRQLFAARRGGLSNELAMQDSSTTSLQAYERGLREQLVRRDEQIKSLQVELRSVQELLAQGYVARNRVSEIERQLLLLQGQRSEDAANIARVQGSVAESRLKVVQRRSTASQDVESQLTEVQSRVNELREQQTALQDELDRIVVRAPGEGVVVDLAVHAAGAVITPSQRLMDIVPAREPLVVEAMLPATLRDNVRVGGACTVRFTGPDQSLTRPVNGQVNYVAADRSVDPARGLAYYVTRVQVSDEALAAGGIRLMQPGMPAVVMITTGERTLLQYLLAPLTKRMNGAMAER